jgi:hypothetical protein
MFKPGPLTLHWSSPRPLRLEFTALTDPGVGVYVIWHNGPQGRWVRVGQGVIKDRVACHRTDPTILAYARFGGLWVRWANLQPHWLDGVERYLAETLRPLVGDRFPDVTPVQVNLPA